MGLAGIGIAIWVVCVLTFGFPCRGFIPADNYLIDCGSPSSTPVGKRVFAADSGNSTFFSTTETIFVTAAEATDSPLHKTARVLLGNSTVTFPIRRVGRHWIRLHFYPFVSQSYDLRKANFSVSAQEFVLLTKFRPKTAIFKEYSLNVTSPKLEIRFSAASTSFAYLSAIEVISAPDDVFNSNELFLFNELGTLSQAVETAYRVNMGGIAVSPDEDILSRTWVSDERYLLDPDLSVTAVNTSAVRYINDYATPQTAPKIVYGSLRRMNTVKYPNKKFNVTWDFKVDSEFQYIFRIHLCDIVSKKEGDLVFSVYVGSPRKNVWTILSNIVMGPLGGAELHTIPSAFFLEKGVIRVSVGPSLDWPDAVPDAILNGLEIFKLNNSAGSLSKTFPL